MIKFRDTPSFQKTFKKLVKKYPSLPEDLKTLKNALIEPYHTDGIDSQGIFCIQGVASQLLEAYVVKKFACKSLKGKGVRSGIRLTYMYDPQKKTVYFVEIYHKNYQEVENKDLLKEVVEELSKDI